MSGRVTEPFDALFVLVRPKSVSFNGVVVVQAGEAILRACEPEPQTASLFLRAPKIPAKKSKNGHNLYYIRDAPLRQTDR